MASVKTAVSIPEDLFRQAEELADKKGLNRSRLYSIALERLVAAEEHDEVTRRLNEALGPDYPTQEDEAAVNFAQASFHEITKDDTW